MFTNIETNSLQSTGIFDPLLTINPSLTEFLGNFATPSPLSLAATATSSASSASSTLYSYNIIARTGSAVPGGTPTSFEDGISINDDGVVAFVGRFGSVEDLLIGDTEPIGLTGETVRNLTTTFSGPFSRAVQLNNNNEVIGQNPGGLSAVRV